MPKVHLEFKDEKGEWKIDAEGWYFCTLNFSNNPRKWIRKVIREYGDEDAKK